MFYYLSKTKNSIVRGNILQYVKYGFCRQNHSLKIPNVNLGGPSKPLVVLNCSIPVKVDRKTFRNKYLKRNEHICCSYKQRI